jgi:dolichol kinase
MTTNGYWGLVYWVAVLIVVSIPTYCLFSLPSGTISVVVTQKWFHLIAILLLGPITWQFPELMSFGYAIAACVLLVCETVRRDLPVLQSFYVTFLDDHKDDGSHIIVSHLFLILGCAGPLWISESIFDRTLRSPSSVLLAELGVILIGIGDSMGAVIGKGIGKHRWGENS